MKWTKLRSIDDHELKLSVFEMPWQASLSEVEGKSNFRIKYLGSPGSLRQWRNRDGASVSFERPLKVIEVIVPGAIAGRQFDGFLSVVRDFFSEKLPNSPDDVEKYVGVMKDAAETLLTDCA